MNNNVIETDAVIGSETEKQEGDTTMNKKVYEFRKLNATDTFLMFKVLSKMNINEIAKGINADSVKGMIGNPSNADATTVGIAVMMEIVNVILTNLPKCENEIYQLLSRTSNLKVDEIQKMDFATFTDMVIDFVKKDEFKDFIKVVSKLFKPVN